MDWQCGKAVLWPAERRVRPFADGRAMCYVVTWEGRSWGTSMYGAGKGVELD